MRGITSRTGLAALTEAANAVVPEVVLGISRSVDDGRVSVLYRNILERAAILRVGEQPVARLAPSRDTLADLVRTFSPP